MDIFDGYYYKSCKRFMMLCGLWPDQTRKRRYFSCIMFLLLNATLAVPQLILLFQKFGKDISVTFENTVSIMFAIGVNVKYLVTFSSKERNELHFIGNRKLNDIYETLSNNLYRQLDSLLTQVANDWQRLTDSAELEILTKNTAQGRLLLIFYTYYVFGAWILYTLMPFLPAAMDFIIPLNESRPLLLPFYANYIFFEQSDYHYWACCHIAFVYLGSFALFSGIDTTYVITVKHTCGLFDIICHRLTNMLNIKGDDILTKLVDNKAVATKLSEAIQLHNETIRCCDLLEDSFNLCFLLVNCMSVVGLALAMVYIILIVEDLFKLIRIVAFVIGLLIHLLYLNWVGQQIINSSEQVFTSAYFSNWYFITNKTRKMISIILIRSLTPCTLTAGKLATLSMENFGILLKTTMSYFTVIISVCE